MFGRSYFVRFSERNNPCRGESVGSDAPKRNSYVRFLRDGGGRGRGTTSVFSFNRLIYLKFNLFFFLAAGSFLNEKTVTRIGDR